MVYIKSWNEYQTKAEQLYAEHPTRVRPHIIRYARLSDTMISPIGTTSFKRPDTV